MFKKFLRGMLIGIGVGSVGILGTLAMVKSIEALLFICKVHNWDSNLVGGIVLICLGSIIYGVLSINNKV